MRALRKLPGLSLALLVLMLLAASFGIRVASVDAATTSTNFENYALGTVDGQFGWSSFGTAGRGCALYDHVIAATSGAPASFGAKSLRISNAVTSGCFSDQTFSHSLADDAGETGAVGGGYSGGVRQPYYEVQFDVVSAVPGAQQPGLSVSVSPDRGDGARVSWLRLFDEAAGVGIEFGDFNGASESFVYTTLASGLNRATPHTIRMTIAFNEGPATSVEAENDVVCVYIDGALAHQGTTWENYFRHPDVNPSPITHPVDSLLFRTGGTAAPATAGNGFLFDNFSQFSGPIPAGFESGCTPAAVSTPQPGAQATAQPLPLCALFGGGTNAIVRADADYNQFCRIINQNGEFVQPAAEVGDPALISAGIRQAVDIFEFNANGERVTIFDRPLNVCLQGTGQFWFRDANGQPRTSALLPSTVNGEYTCATIPHAGTVVLAGQ